MAELKNLYLPQEAGAGMEGNAPHLLGEGKMETSSKPNTH